MGKRTSRAESQSDIRGQGMYLGMRGEEMVMVMREGVEEQSSGTIEWRFFFSSRSMLQKNSICRLLLLSVVVVFTNHWRRGIVSPCFFVLGDVVVFRLV